MKQIGREQTLIVRHSCLKCHHTTLRASFLLLRTMLKM